MIEIAPYTEHDLDALREALCEAFSDYVVPMRPTPEQFRFMLRQRGFDAGLTWLARSNGRIVGFWLLGSNGEAQRESAYVIATGTVPDHRGHGIATDIFERMSPALVQGGVKRVELEVIDQNTAARNAYEMLGFTPQREAACFTLPTPNNGASTSAHPRIRPIPLEAIQMTGSRLWDWEPTWQNSLEALQRIKEDVEAVGAYNSEGLMAYGAVIRPTAKLAQLAVHRNRRRRGFGTEVLAALTTCVKCDSLQVINAEASDSGFSAFIERNQGIAGTRQFVLSRKL